MTALTAGSDVLLRRVTSHNMSSIGGLHDTSAPDSGVGSR
jgi:hypothetical protein